MKSARKIIRQFDGLFSGGLASFYYKIEFIGIKLKAFLFIRL